MRPVLDHDAITELATSYASEHHCPTLAWGIVGDGLLAATGSVGDVDEHTVYRIASMTKSFSAAATLWLRDAGVLRLDDPIGVHATELSDLRSPTADAPEITIRDLLSMTSGLATDDPWADRHLDLTDDEFDAIVSRGLLFSVPTGTIHEYSNFGYAVLGRVVQRASGRRIQDVVSEELLPAIGMGATTWSQPMHGEWAPPLDWRDGQYVDELPPLADGLIAAMGGIWTSVADLARWVTWLDDAYPARDDPDDGPLSRASRREMQTIQRYVGYRTVRGVRCASGYGYGLRVMDDPELGDVITHSGGVPGYGSNMRWVRGRRTGVIALANSTYAPVTELTARMLDLVTQQGFIRPATPPADEQVSRAAARLVALLNDWDDHTADELFADNVLLDESYLRRQSAATRYIPLTLAGVDVVNASSGTAVCSDADGERLEVSFSLAPLQPPRIQEYEIKKPGV
jgi:CubicO group peptidase (beta-lactamase class C family)